MMKRFVQIFWLVALAIVLLVSCHKNDDEPQRINPHTVIFFFPYSEDMTSFFKRNINDIEAAAQNGAFTHERLIICISSTKNRADIIELRDNKRDKNQEWFRNRG